MVRLASLNLNKRLGNPAARGRLTTWLHHHRVDLLIVQEPWKPIDRAPVELAGFTRAGGDGRHFCWIAERFAPPVPTWPDSFVQRLELSWLLVFNAYLDCASTATRRAQLQQLREIIMAEQGRPAIVCGDFNLAPRPIDGLTNGRPSTFNNASDRTPFDELVAEGAFVDATGTDPPEFTIERQRPTVTTRFRCDLALVPRHLRPMVSVRYDHVTRAGEQPFTDHSAVMVDVPVTLAPAAEAERDTLFTLLPPPVERTSGQAVYQPHKTAMTRARSSPFARTVVAELVPMLGITRILDHGCGRGTDVDHYRTAGLEADGWDPHPGFGHTAEPQRRYDLVTSIFVLNVLPDPWQRIRALQHAARFVRPGGHLFVVTRSPTDIDGRAASAKWPPHHDGYWSSEARGTFQKGLSVDEIHTLAHHAGLRPAPDQALPRSTPAACQALLTKAGP